MALSYKSRYSITVWRKKSLVLISVVLLLIIIYGLQYNRINDKKDAPGFVEFLHLNQLSYGSFLNKGGKNGSKPMRYNANGMEEARESVYSSKKSANHRQPSIVIDTEKLYIPPHRIAHFDLKGAPPKVSYLKRIFPLLKSMGATGILLEYEDMFPYSGRLKHIAARNAYSRQEIEEILMSAYDHKLEVIPLMQTFGHVEFALKHASFVNLREVPGSPQALCPSRNASLDFVKEMAKQVLALHPKISYLHIGCDEVFQMGECEVCRLVSRDTLFLKHVRNVARIIHKIRPGLKLIIWDDMLRHMTEKSMTEVGLGELVEPMIWVYVEQIYKFVQPEVWEVYAGVFKSVWAASAFKGAFGETLFIPDVKRHLENNLRWLEVMSQQAGSFANGFAGIALTGWQRYDHFAVLCELLPAALPSLAMCMLAVSHGFFNESLRQQVASVLSCPSTGRSVAFLNFDDDPFLWERMGRCMFPGSPFFRLTYRYSSTEKDVLDFLETTKRKRGWLTEYNVRRNYSLPMRIEELTADLSRLQGEVAHLAKSAADAMADVFDDYTIAEWVEQHVLPHAIQLERVQNESAVLRSVQTWGPRPLPPLKELRRLGFSVPDEDSPKASTDP